MLSSFTGGYACCPLPVANLGEPVKIASWHIPALWGSEERTQHAGEWFAEELIVSTMHGVFLGS